MFDNLIKHELTVVFKQGFPSDFKSLHFGVYIFIVIVQEEQGRVLLKVVNPNVDVNVDVDVTFVNFAFY